MLLGLGVVATLVAASAAPVEWFGPEEYTVTATSQAHWHGLQGKWSVTPPVLDEREARLIELGAYFQNALALTSAGAQVVFTLEQTPGLPIQTIHQKTGKGVPVFDDDTTLVVKFLGVEPGSYIARVRVVSPDGTTQSEAQTPFTLLSEASH